MRIGRIVNRGRMLRDGPTHPARVATLDEVVLVVRRETPLRFDPSLKFHLYGADLCLQASEPGPGVVSLEALCHHNSPGSACLRSSWSMRRHSPESRRTGCLSPRRASSSIGEARSTSSAMHAAIPRSLAPRAGRSAGFRCTRRWARNGGNRPGERDSVGQAVQPDAAGPSGWTA